MKFDPFAWNEVTPNVEIEIGKGKLQLRLSQAAPLYVTAQGCEALAGVGTSFDLDLSEEMTYRIDAPEGVRAFQFVPEQTACDPDDETFTNIDRMPNESGSVAEVTRALRMLEIERRSVLSEIRSERALTLAQVAAARAETAPEAATSDEVPATGSEATE